jgi:hypothetical protein
VEDSVEIELDIDVADPRVLRPSATELSLAIATESSTSTPDALRLPDWGVHPLSVQLVIDGDEVADVSTFVARSAIAGSAEDEANDLAVSLVIGTTQEPTIANDGLVQPSRAELAELSLLADALAAADSAAATLGVDPAMRAVALEPATLTVLPDVDPDLADRLVTVLENSDVIARPRLPFDPSAAVAADRSGLYTQLLREGEDALAGALPSTPVDRSIVVATEPISRAAVALRRDLGTQLIILPYDRYRDLDGSIDAFTDTSQLLELDLGEGTQVPAMLIDPILSELLESDDDGESLSTAIAVVAQLVALARQIDAGGGSVARHGMILARSDGGVPQPELLGHVTRLLLESDGVRIVEPSDLASIVDNQIIDGRGLEVTPQDGAGPDLRRRFAAVDALARDVLGTASMLPEDEPLVASWTTVLGAVVSTALDEDEAQAMIAALRAQIDVYRNGVQGPAPYTFRVTGGSGSIPFELRNLTDRALSVRIRMTSAKLEFRDADLEVTLPPLQEVEVSMPFEALSNGTSSVFLRIFTPAPDPSDETQIVDDIVLTARVTTLAGLGQLVTGAALLVLCTWWIRHWRQARRRRLANAVAPRHPASNGVGTIDGSDAAARDVPTAAAASQRAAPVRRESRVAAAVAPDAPAGTGPPS